MIARICGIAAMLAGCAVVPPADEARQAEGAPPVAVATAAPAPSPTSTLPPAEPERPDWTYSGELTQGGWIRGTVPSGTVSARLGDQALAFDEEGRFFAAFDRDAGTSAALVAERADGQTIIARFTVSPREWSLEYVNTALRPGGGSSEAFMRRRQPELDAIWDARTADMPATGWQEDWIWPVTGRISGRFGSQRIYRGEPGSYHSGLDIARPTGTEFVAPASGVVTLATSSPFSIEGYLLIIDHGQGLNSAFLHLSRIDVREGDRVVQGQTLGAIGSSGRATGPHLHWSIKWHLARLDPLLFVGPMP